jgi:acyl carrier protein
MKRANVMSADLKEKLRAIVAEVSEIDTIPDSTPFSELGIDSMMAIEIVAEVERQYKVSVPEEELKSVSDFNSVYALFAKRIN